MKTTPVLAVAVTAFIAIANQPVWAAGGDTCGAATVVSTVPFSDNGTTCGSADDYDEHCNSASSAPDVVYQLTPAENRCVNVSMCNGTDFDAKLYVYSSATGNCPAGGSGNTTLDVACAESGCPGGGGALPRIANLQLTGGVTYWFVVDGAGDACGNYQITFNDCPSGCVDDSECCDGNFCNGREFCGPGGVCMPGVMDCNDQNPCTTDSCSPGLETCINTPIEGCCLSPAQCDDGNPCTNDFCDRPDTCDTGTCVYMPRAAGAPCGNQQTSACNLPNTCDGEGSCAPNFVENGTSCNDGQFCTISTTCLDGVCAGGEQRECDDENPCTTDNCDEETRACEYRLTENCCLSNDDCDDGNECTADVCQEGICDYPFLATGTACGSNAQTACSGADFCQQGICRPNNNADGTDCNDGNFCTTGDACQSGVCKGAPNPICALEAHTGGLNPLARQLSFQAFLTDDLGDPLDGPTDLQFQLYDGAGNPIGSPILIDGTMVDNGLVSTQIPVPFGALNGEAGTLGVQINGGEELSPRVPLTSAAYALNVDSVGSAELSEHLTLGGGESGGEIRIFGPDETIAGGTFSGAHFVAGTVTDIDADGVLRVCGQQTLADDTGDLTVLLNACDPAANPILVGGGGGQMRLADSTGTVRLRLDATNTGDLAPELVMLDDQGDVEIVKLVGSENGSDGPQLTMRNSQNKISVVLDSESPNGSHLYLKDEDGDYRMVEIVSTEDGTDGAQIILRQADGHEGVQIDAESSTGAKIRLYQNDYNPDVSSLADDIGVLLDGNYDSGTGSTGHGRIRVRNESGESTITLDGDWEDSGKGRVRTDILKIDGGSDLSESFDVSGDDVQPGYLVSIDPASPGKLVVSMTSYDRRLAGVISGAGGIDPGLVMGQIGTIADGEHPVAMSGRVYCWADATTAPIVPGDLLTTSNVPGHAMRANDAQMIHGAVIGKAMSPLSEGRGLVLVLIRPQ